MVGSDAGAWARLRLVQGGSETLTRVLEEAEAELRLTVGSHHSCDWVVSDPSVAPVHMTLHWDGVALSVADCHGAGRVRLDGQPIGVNFTRASGRSRIEFGRCALVAETSAGAGARQTQPPISAGGVPAPSRDAVSEGSGLSAAPKPPKPLARTLLGVAPTTAELPPRSDSPPSDAVKVSQPVRTGTSSNPPADGAEGEATGEPTPTGLRRNHAAMKATVMGMAPLQDLTPEPRTPPPAQTASSERPPLGATLYGLGKQGQGPHRVDVVSSARLRSSSLPPRAAEDEGNSASVEPPGRTTRLGFGEGAGAAANRATRLGFGEPPGQTGVRAEAEATHPVDEPVGPSPIRGGAEGNQTGGAWPGEPERGEGAGMADQLVHEPSRGWSQPEPHQAWASEPSRRGRGSSDSKAWPIAIGAVTVLAFAIWVYALLTL